MPETWASIRQRSELLRSDELLELIEQIVRRVKRHFDRSCFDRARVPGKNHKPFIKRGGEDARVRFSIVLKPVEHGIGVVGLSDDIFIGIHQRAFLDCAVWE